MEKRYVCIWFRHLLTDWFSLQDKSLKNHPFVLRVASHGRMVVSAVNAAAEQEGIFAGMVLADARAIVPSLQVKDEIENLSERLLKKLGEYCIRFSPLVAIDLPDSLIIDASGCAHLWKGEENYMNDIIQKIKVRGYDVRVAMAGNIGTAWAVAHFESTHRIVDTGRHLSVLLPLPAQALRLSGEAVEKLNKLGLKKIGDFISIPIKSLKRRFGDEIIIRISQATGVVEERIEPIVPVPVWQERLPCLEPIITPGGIEIAIKKLLDAMCNRLAGDQKGLRKAVLKLYRTDNTFQAVEIGTGHTSHNADHLYKLFELKIGSISPEPGIELFVLEAQKVEEHLPAQEKIWENAGGLNNQQLSELLDRICGRLGQSRVRRFVADEHYWPERSFRQSNSLREENTVNWNTGKRRPVVLLQLPELIEVTAPIPDYPPMLFRMKGKIHRIKKADGPERIEQEWWLQEGEHRDYYYVEDEDGCRYWLFRSGHYNENGNAKWYLHGYFA
jgi:protein ImuB